MESCSNALGAGQHDDAAPLPAPALLRVRNESLGASSNRRVTLLDHLNHRAHAGLLDLRLGFIWWTKTAMVSGAYVRLLSSYSLDRTDPFETL